MKYHMDTPLDFGKYNGEKMMDVIESDPKYLMWCIEQGDDFRHGNPIKLDLMCTEALEESLSREITLDTVLALKKHKGKTIQDVLVEDPTYIEWAVDNVSDFNLDAPAAAALDDALIGYYDDNFDYM